MGDKFVVPDHLKIHEPITQPGKRNQQQYRGESEPSILGWLDH
jgi:hypothetical protein